ncbi:MAG: hypothetical protein ACK4NE_06325 [Albidovulum sp.]
MKSRHILVLAAASLLAALPVSAEDAQTPVDPATIDPVARMEKAVNTKALERIMTDKSGLLSPGDGLRLLIVAQQRALAENCDGYAVDETKFAAVMSDILSGLQGMTEEGQNNLAVDMVMGAYAMSLGGLTAVAAYDTARFCARGTEIRDELTEDTEGRISVLMPAQ